MKKALRAILFASTLGVSLAVPAARADDTYVASVDEAWHDGLAQYPFRQKSS